MILKDHVTRKTGVMMLFNFDVGLVQSPFFKTFPMRRRRLKARVYFTFRVPFRLAHSRRVRAAFKVYSAAEECGRTSSTHAQDHQLDLRGLIKLPALGRGVRLYASPLDDENYIYRGLARIWPVCRKPHQT